MAARKLEVYLHGIKSGVLQDNDGSLSFKYEDGAANPLSVRMPVREQEYTDRECRPFFENLLPEGAVRSAVALKERVSEGNVFSMLDRIGGDCAGAVSLYEEGSKETGAADGPPEEITGDELYRIINSQRTSPLLSGRDIRLSLAGAQPKFAVYMKEGRMYYPRGGYFSSHLIKPRSAGFEGLAINEYFCMRLAAKTGIAVPYVELRRVKGTEYLLVDRFDRLTGSGGRERVHQEDLCQALGYTSDRKYQKEGGPGLKDCYEFLSGVSGIGSSERFVTLLVYNYLTGNCDAHAKNFSILHGIENIRYAGGAQHAARKPGAVTLAPFYDLVSTDAYGNLSKDMAMKVGGAWDIREVQKHDLYRFADEVKIKEKEMDRILGNFLALPEAAQKTAAEISGMGFDTGICAVITEGIVRRLGKIKK